jgi:putative Mg2+ transporter-C (MgtC) family protein
MAAVVGFERERQNQVAGLRTHLILGVGSSLAMILSIYLAVHFKPQTGNADPARLAAQVVSGIGFLGAGAILRYGTNVRGLTTATSLWTVAMIGLAVGAGLYIPGAAATVLLLLALTFFNFVEKRLVKSYTTWSVCFVAGDRPDLTQVFEDTVKSLGLSVSSEAFTMNVEEKELTIEGQIQTVEKYNIKPLVDKLTSIPGAHTVEVRNIR